MQELQLVVQEVEELQPLVERQGVQIQEVVLEHLLILLQLQLVVALV
jgi:hypothetical protein